MKTQKNLRVSKLTEQQIDELTERLGMSQTELITVAINEYHKKMEDKMTDEKIISFDDFCDWHTVHSLDDISPDKLREAYNVYLRLFLEGDAEYADEKITGHPVWNDK